MNPLISAGTEIAWHGFKRFISVVVWTLVLAGMGWAVYAGIAFWERFCSASTITSA